MTRTRNNHIEDYRVLTILSLLNTCGAAVFFFAPLLVGGYVTQLGFSSQQSGYVISSELAGFALAPIPAAIWVRKISWRVTLYCSIAMVILMNLVTGSLSGFSAYLAVRFVSGFAAGVQLAVCMAVIHSARDPDRSLGFWFSLQLLLGSVGLIFLPGLIGAFGVGAVFLLLAVSHALLLIFIHKIPDGATTGPTPEVKATGSVYTWAFLGFSAIFLFEFGIMGIWTYYERIGAAAAIPNRTITFALSASIFLGFVGASAAAYLSTRFSRIVPVVVGSGLAVLSMALLLGQFSTTAYIISAGLYGFAWYFTLPYLMASIANVDSSGRLLILSNMVANLGVAAGPACAALLQSGEDYTLVLYMGISAMLLSLLFIIRVAAQPARE